MIQKLKEISLSSSAFRYQFPESINVRMVFPIALQVFLYASKAASALSPHRLLICSWTLE